jgi:hypothetical protein
VIYDTAVMSYCGVKKARKETFISSKSRVTLFFITLHRLAAGVSFRHFAFTCATGAVKIFNM